MTETGQDGNIAALMFFCLCALFFIKRLIIMKEKEKYMQVALEEAKKAFVENEVPIGAVLVYKNKIIAKAHNKKEMQQNVLSHAELILINEVSKKNNNWRLDDYEIYITLEPCPMCASAIQQSRISQVYYAVQNSDSRVHELVEKIFLPSNTNPGVEVYSGILEKEAKEILQDFFRKKRL